MSLKSDCNFAGRCRRIVLFVLINLAVFLTFDNLYPAQKKFVPRKPHLNIGVLGPAAHGGTLTSAITKVLSRKDQAKFVSIDELKKASVKRSRGIPMRISFIEYETEKRHYSHFYGVTDRDYSTALITGAANLDGAILVVPAAAGPSQQLHEHALLAKQVGIPSVVLFLDNAEILGDKKRLARVEQDARDVLCIKVRYCQKIAVISGSSAKALEDVSGGLGESAILELMKAVDSNLPDSVKNIDKPFLMPVEDVFSISGRGTVVTGRIEQGRLRVQDEVEIVGMRPTQKTVATGVEMFRKLLDEGQAGDNVGVLLRGTKREDVERGQVLTKPGTINPHTKFSARVYILTKEEGGRHAPFSTGYRPQFYFRTTDVTGVVRLSEGVGKVMPGDNTTIAVELHTVIAMQPGLRFAIREGGRTVGAGIVLQIVQ